MTAQFEASQDSHQPSMNDLSRPLVVLVHGIRTSGKWIRRIKPILEARACCVVEPAGFGFFDVFRFMLPGPTRKAVIETVKWKLLHAIDRHRERPLIIVAHSFGTFCITEILKDSPQIRPTRLLFCGSIVAQNFRWDSLSQMAPDRGMRVVNECGARDIWPPLAHSVTFGYGSSGTGGFQVPGVEDRCHDLGHSGYFTKEFVQQFWVPFIKDGTISHSQFEEEMPEAPWWISVMGLRPLLPWVSWMFLAVLSGAIIFGLRLWKIKQPAGVQQVDQSAQTNSMVAAVAYEAQQAEKYADDRYLAISSVLQNPQATVAQQVAALRELPEAMCARVPVATVDNDAPGGMRTESNIPNLIRLRNVLREYIRFDRTQQFSKVESDDIYNTMRPLADASTEILYALHRLGPSNPAKPQQHLWTWLPKNYKSGVPRSSEADPAPEPRPKFDRQDERIIELSHMDARDFERLCVPFAMYDTQRSAQWTVVFPAGAIFRRAKLQGAHFYKSELHEADFTEAEMQRADFLLAKMRRAKFYKTNLQGATIQQADLRGAHFEDSSANGADFGSADLSGARFSFCSLEGSDFEGAKLDWGRVLGNAVGANMKFASLKGAHLYGDFAGADFFEAVLKGTMLEGASFGGRRLYCKVGTVTGPPSGSFAWGGLFEPILDASDEASNGRVAILFPGAVLSKLKEIDAPLKYVRLVEVSRGECLQELTKLIAAKRGDTIYEQAEDILAQVRYLSDHELENVLWPDSLEPVLKQAFGGQRTQMRERAVTLLRVGIGRTSFKSKDGAAWMDKATLELFSKILADDVHVAMARNLWEKGKIDDIRADLSQVEPRGNYSGAWLHDRSQWSFWREFEKANPSASK
jgi:uncharacterized protein YjbI with pentapeptide repeats